MFAICTFNWSAVLRKVQKTFDRRCALRDLPAYIP